MLNRNNQFAAGLFGQHPITPIGQCWQKNMVHHGGGGGGAATGFNQSVPKLPSISGCMPNQPGYAPYDHQGKDGGYIQGQQKNMGLYDYSSLPSQHMLTGQLMQEAGMTPDELLNNIATKIKPYDMQYSGISGLMG